MIIYYLLNSLAVVCTLKEEIAQYLFATIAVGFTDETGHIVHGEAGELGHILLNYFPELEEVDINIIMRSLYSISSLQIHRLCEQYIVE